MCPESCYLYTGILLPCSQSNHAERHHEFAGEKKTYVMPVSVLGMIVA